MANAFLLEIAVGVGQIFQDGNNAVIVYANDATEAKKIAQDAFKWDAMNAVWNSSLVTVTSLVAPTDWFTPNEWNFEAIIANATTGVIEYDVTVKSDNTNKTVDLIGALLAAALVAKGLTATYTAGTNTLQLAAAGDNKGDRKVTMRAWPTIDGGDNSVSINSASFFGAITDGGSAGAALTCVLVADATVPTAAFYRAVKAV